MEIKEKEIEYCKFEVDVVAPQENVNNARRTVLDQFKNAPCPGFRKGKASKEAIKTYYKSQMEDAVKRLMAEEVFHETLFQKEWRNLGSPKFNTMFIKNDKYFCNFTLDIAPKFELKDVKNIQIPKPHQPESREDVAAQKMEELRVRFGETRLFDENDFIENGDSVIISYKAFDGDLVVEQLCSDSEVVEVGTKTDRDFSDNLLGMKVSEEREFDYTIKSTAETSLANKTVKFKVKLSNGTKTVPHPVNNELAQKMGKESLIELQDHVNRIASGIIDTRMKQQLQQAVANSVVEIHDFKVQDWLVEKEAIMLCNSAKIDYSKLVEDDKNNWKKIANRNVKLSLILEKVRESEPEAQLTDQEVLEELKKALSSQLQDNSNESLLNYLSKMGAYSQVLFARVKDEFALNYIVKFAKVVE